MRRCELLAGTFLGVFTLGLIGALYGAADDVADGFIRLSVGLEDAADLIADLTAALAAG